MLDCHPVQTHLDCISVKESLEKLTNKKDIHSMSIRNNYLLELPSIRLEKYEGYSTCKCHYYKNYIKF